VKSPFRVGDNIYLRALERSDAATVTPWFNDLELTRNLLRYRPMSVEEEETFIARLADQPTDLVLGVVEKSSDALCGVSGLHGFGLPDRKAMFGIVIAQPWQGKGYGTETTRLMVRIAFDTLNVHRVWLEVFADNARAIRAYEKVGFVREGVARQAAWRDGRWRDEVLMAILRE
jgi:RimJ/RimL family protein N-acetyltransferase